MKLCPQRPLIIWLPRAMITVALWVNEEWKSEKSERLLFSSCQLMLSQLSTYRPSGHRATIRGYFDLKKNHNMKEEGVSSRLSLCLLEWFEQEDLQRLREFSVISACSFMADNRENGQKYLSGVLRIDVIACSIFVKISHVCLVFFPTSFFVFSVFNS